MSTAKGLIEKAELSQLLFLRGAEIESLFGLLEKCNVRDIQRGDILIHAAHPNHYLYLVLSGHLRVHLKLTLDPIAILGPGEVAGELSLIDGHPTAAYVVAAEDCRLMMIDEKTLWSLVDCSHAIARNLLFLLARRLRHGNSLILTSQQLEREYERFAVMDALTGAYNRRWLDSMLARQIERSKAVGWPLTILLIDIDGFKPYNDTHGHVSGDRALYTVARILREKLGSGSLTARYGGDELIVLLPDQEIATAMERAEILRQAVAEAPILALDRTPLPSVTISIGVVEMLPDDSPETLIEAADIALYHAKVKGGNRTFRAKR